MFSYLLSIFIASFLLFQIQPLIAKYILPWFGGTSGVWSASLLFFQILLTAGYGYSYWLTSIFKKRWQGIIHLGLLGFSLILIVIGAIRWKSPILPEISLQTLNLGQPSLEIIWFLFLAVGIPFFLLSTNSTIMQTWFTYEKENKSPFKLYAVSNAGSLLGLVSYPFLFEPNINLVVQSNIWIAGYILFIILVGIRAWKVKNEDVPDKKNQTMYTVLEKQKTSLKHRFTWLYLSALAAMLLLATTNHITQEVSSIPFLWVLPLSAYLLSFILTFSNQRLYNRYIFYLLLLLTTIIFIWFVDAATSEIIFQVIFHVSLLFICSMICHGELYRNRPDQSNLAIFYLMISIGGAIGGLAVNFLFPSIFSGFWEYQFSLGLVWGYVFLICNNQSLSNRYFIDRAITIFAGMGIILVFASLYIRVDEYEKEAIISRRNFYGILRIKELSENDPENHRYVLTHGITTHGFQFTSPEKQMLPTAYYSEKSGIGIVFENHPVRPKPIKVGFVGLGAGVLASYGQEGDRFFFYEINPEVAEIAQSKYFSYLSLSNADVAISLGDGRVQLEQDLFNYGPSQFDLLILDAFNSDSIPTHLLTQEAVELYLNHLKPDGLLAFHISNRFLDLEPVVYQIADHFSIDGVTFYDTTKDERISPSKWVILTNNQHFLGNLEVVRQGSFSHPSYQGLRLWSDDYSNLFTIIK